MACSATPPLRKLVKLFAVLLGALLVTTCASVNRQDKTPQAVESSPGTKNEITIALLGATGMVGGFILQEALGQGYDVRALARTPQKLAAFKDRITIVHGDAKDRQAIDTLLRGSHAVISALGPVKADGNAALMISTTASGHVIQSMLDHSIERYIVVSGAAVSAPGDDRRMTGWLLRQAASLALHSTLKDKQAEYQLLKDSSSAWTLIRCPIIDPEPFEQNAIVSLATPPSFQLRAGELARFIIEQIVSQKFIGEAPFLGSE